MTQRLLANMMHFAGYVQLVLPPAPGHMIKSLILQYGGVNPVRRGFHVVVVFNPLETY